MPRIEVDLLDLGFVLFVGQDLNLKMESEEKKLKLSAHKIAMNRSPKILMMANFPMGGFIVLRYWISYDEDEGIEA